MTGAQPMLRIERDSEVEHSYLWCKTVHAVNLGVHCFHALVGAALPVDQQAQDQAFALPQAPAWYLCGVTRPYRWELNSHVLLLPDPDALMPRTVTTPALYVTMWGLRAAEITGIDLLDADRDGQLYDQHEAYTTCRNLQAAHLLHARHGFRHDGERAPELRRQQARRAGIPVPRI